MSQTLSSGRSSLVYLLHILGIHVFKLLEEMRKLAWAGPIGLRWQFEMWRCCSAWRSGVQFKPLL